MTVYDESNIFAKILRGEIPCNKVYEDNHVLAFHDLYPKAPVHVLVIPKGAYVSLVDFSEQASAEELKAFWAAVAKVAHDLGLTEEGFRTIANTGLNGGQEVPHFHVHLLGGKSGDKRCSSRRIQGVRAAIEPPNAPSTNRRH
ncbi:MAG: histidine triad nucleotide-binding protein [Alphaproteobacteria bacterium]|nr:histidine triad nucleotide-binding protein [Alphaproteobacteria bacterium]